LNAGVAGTAAGGLSREKANAIIEGGTVTAAGVGQHRDAAER